MDYINENCFYQYIATSISWNRGYLNNPNNYYLTVNAEQNIATEDGKQMIKIDPETGDILECNVRCIAVFYDKEDNPLRWAEASVIKYDPNGNIYSFRFTFTTKDYIDTDNRIRIDTGVYDLGTNNESYAHFNANTKCIIHFLSKQGEEYGRNKLDEIVPYLDGYTLSNSYTVMDGIDFFYDYSDIINSTIVYDNDDRAYFRIKGVPVVKYDYFENEDKVNYFCNELVKRKTYIDYAVEVLEDAFGMDFKFFNTYGPSKLFTTDNSIDYLNRTCLSLTFRLKLKPNYDTNIINDMINDIKTYIENINEINSLHIPNLITEITNTYKDSIVFFEFLDMNGYGPSVQHLYSMDMPDEVITPEFLNVAALPDGTPDINIILA